MDFAVATPSFLEELIVVLAATLLSSDESIIEDDHQGGKSYLVNEIQTATIKFLELLPREDIPATCKDQIAMLQILVKPGTSFTAARDIIYERYGVELSSLLTNVRKIELVYLRDLKNRLHLKVEYLRLKPTLEYLQDILTNSENITDLVTFIKDAAKEILNTISFRKMFDKFDTANSDLSKIISDYEHILNPRNYITTGFPILDKKLYGGFAKTRIYVIAGPSGSGKSTYLLNFLWRALQFHSNKQFVYVTLENIVPETLLRLACIQQQRNILEDTMNNSDTSELLNSLTKVTEAFTMRGNRVQILYYDSSTTIETIMNDLRGIAKDRPELAAVYFDYLNVMAVTKEDKRTFLGQVTKLLKDVAVELQIPVITAAQLNREAYDLETGRELSLSQMGEAMLIVENSDVVLLTANEKKNRLPNPTYQDGRRLDVAALKVGKSRYAKDALFTVMYERETYTVQNMVPYSF